MPGIDVWIVGRLMSPALNGSFALQCFKLGKAVKNAMK